MEMNWKQLERRLRSELGPAHRGILKCQGSDRRAIVSNNGNVIVMRTGINDTHSISYEMIHYAFNILSTKEIFNSQDFRARFAKELADATCRYSMTGGILVELQLAQRIIKGKSCYYTKR